MDAAVTPSVSQGTKSSGPTRGQSRSLRELGERRSNPWGEVAALALYFALRLPELTALPIFVDESFYLHQAQLVRRDPAANAFVSVVDPKPPFHIWLVAALLPIDSDPLWSGRFVSVLAGAATVLLLFPLCRMLLLLDDPGPGAADRRFFPLIAALLAATCPYLAFYDRLAAPDALVVAESALVAWLSLRLARAVWTEPASSASPGRGGRVIALGAALGAALGVAMFTRQYFSYVLWLLPPLAVLLWPRAAALVSPTTAFSRFARTALAAVPVALAIWAPYLLARSNVDVWTRVFYREHYLEGAMGASTRIRLALGNAFRILSPFQPDAGGQWRFDTETGWLWTYLTPPIAIAAAVGLARMATRREWRVSVFLGGWFLLTFAPLAIFGTVLFPRYGLPAVVPLLVAAALPFSEALAASRAPRSFAARVAGLAGLAAVLAWPLVSVTRQWTDWSRQRFVEADRSQYVSGWPGGSAVRQAIDLIAERSRTGPVVVLNVIGDLVPNLAVTVAFERDPRVRVLHSDWGGLVASAESWGQSGRLFGRSDFRESPPETVAVPPKATVLVVRPEPLSVNGSVVGSREIASWGRLKPVATFVNPPAPGARGPRGAISVAEIIAAPPGRSP